MSSFSVFDPCFEVWVDFILFYAEVAESPIRVLVTRLANSVDALLLIEAQYEVEL